MESHPLTSKFHQLKTVAGSRGRHSLTLGAQLSSAALRLSETAGHIPQPFGRVKALLLNVANLGDRDDRFPPADKVVDDGHAACSTPHSRK